MTPLNTLVHRAQDGDPHAFSDLVSRFQDMAVGYAFAILGDFHLAEDAAQEAFLDAFLRLNQLRRPEAFPGWLRKVIFKHCDRFTRRKRVVTTTLRPEMTDYMMFDPVTAVEEQEMKTQVLDTVRALPEKQREIVTLFYIKDLTQQEIAQFLDVPVSTVNSRLHAARKTLKERMLKMVEDTLHENAPSNDNAFIEKFKVADLCRAAAKGDVKRVNLILAASTHLASVDMAPDDEHRALHHAVLNRRPEVVRILMAAGSDPHQGIYPHRDATTPLALARDRGYGEIVEIIEQALEERRKANLCPNLTVTPAIRALVEAIAGGEETAALQMIGDDPELVNACDEGGNTALHHAARCGYPRLVQALLKVGADPGKQNLEEKTPLETAVEHTTGRDRKTAEGCFMAAGILIQAGAGQSLRVLVMLGDLGAVRRIAEDHPGVFKPDVENETHLLGDAVRHGRLEMVRLLLDLGMDPDQRFRIAFLETETYNWGEPLWIAAGDSMYDIAEMLLEAGADPNAQVYASGDPMSRAFNNRDERMKNLLYRYGATITPEGAALECDTAAAAMALHLKPELAEGILWGAACGGDPDLVGLCLRRIDWTPDDPRWYRILDQPTRIWPCGPHRKYTDFDRSVFPAIFEMILKRGVDPNVKGRRETSLLHNIAAIGKVWGQPVLTEDERLTFATLLLDYGAELNVRDRLLQSTPLAWAARWGRPALVRLYLERGAKTGLPDDEPWATPLAWAERHGHADIADLLRKHGATE